MWRRDLRWVQAGTGIGRASRRDTAGRTSAARVRTAATCASGRSTQISSGRAPSASRRVGRRVEVADPVHGDRQVRAGSGRGPRRRRRRRTVTPSRASWRSRMTSGRPATVTGTSGTSTPGAGTGTSPRAGRPGNGRRSSGVVSGESTYQNGSASRPESTCARAAGSVGGPLEHRRGGARASLRAAGHQEAHGGAGDVEVLHAPRRAARRGSCPAAPPVPSRAARRRASRRRSPRPARRSSGRGRRTARPGARRRRRPAPGRPASGRRPGSGTGRPTSTRSRRAGRR